MKPLDSSLPHGNSSLRSAHQQEGLTSCNRLNTNGLSSALFDDLIPLSLQSTPTPSESSMTIRSVSDLSSTTSTPDHLLIEEEDDAEYFDALDHFPEESVPASSVQVTPDQPVSKKSYIPSLVSQAYNAASSALSSTKAAVSQVKEMSSTVYSRLRQEESLSRTMGNALVEGSKQIGKGLLGAAKGVGSFCAQKIKPATTAALDYTFNDHLSSVTVVKNPCPPEFRTNPTEVPAYIPQHNPVVDDYKPYTDKELKKLQHLTKAYANSFFLFKALFGGHLTSADYNLFSKIALESSEEVNGKRPSFRSVFFKHVPMTWYQKIGAFCIHLFVCWIPDHFIPRCTAHILKIARDAVCQEDQSFSSPIISTTGKDLSTFLDKYKEAYVKWSQDPSAEGLPFEDFLHKTLPVAQKNNIKFGEELGSYISNLIPPLNFAKRLFNILLLRLWKPENILGKAVKRLAQVALFIPTIILSAIGWLFDNTYNRLIKGKIKQYLSDEIPNILGNFTTYFHSKEYKHLLHQQMLYQLTNLKEVLKKQQEEILDKIARGLPLDPMQEISVVHSSRENPITGDLEVRKVSNEVAQKLAELLPIAGLEERKEIAKYFSSKAPIDPNTPLAQQVDVRIPADAWIGDKLARFNDILEGAIVNNTPALINLGLSQLTPKQFEYILYKGLTSANHTFCPAKELSEDELKAKYLDMEVTSLQLENTLNEIASIIIETEVKKAVYGYLPASISKWFLGENGEILPHIQQELAYRLKKHYLQGAYTIGTNPFLTDRVMYLGLDALLQSKKK